jgi:hypothetical protein
MWRLSATLLGLSMACALAADAEPKSKPPKADVRGKIETVSLKGGMVGRLLIEGTKEKDTQHDKASVRLTKATKVYKWVDGKKKEAKVEDLKKGATVQADFTGPVAESYPVQATAKEILILDAPKEK